MNPCDTIKSKDNEGLVRNLEALLIKERDGFRKRKIGFIVSGVIVLVVLLFITHFVSKYVSPAFMLDYAHVRGLEQVDEINANLRSSAPAIVKGWSHTLIDQVPAHFREQMMATLTPAIGRFADQFAGDLNTELAKFINRPEIQSVLNGQEDPQKGYKQLFGEINTTLSTEISGFYAENSKAFESLRKDLLKLKNSANLTPKEQYAKKVIGAWLSLLDQQGAKWDSELLIPKK